MNARFRKGKKYKIVHLEGCAIFGNVLKYTGFNKYCVTYEFLAFDDDKIPYKQHAHRQWLKDGNLVLEEVK